MATIRISSFSPPRNSIPTTQSDRFVANVPADSPSTVCSSILKGTFSPFPGPDGAESLTEGSSGQSFEACTAAFSSAPSTSMFIATRINGAF